MENLKYLELSYRLKDGTVVKCYLTGVQVAFIVHFLGYRRKGTSMYCFTDRFLAETNDDASLPPVVGDADGAELMFFFSKEGIKTCCFLTIPQRTVLERVLGISIEDGTIGCLSDGELMKPYTAG